MFLVVFSNGQTKPQSITKHHCNLTPNSQILANNSSRNLPWRYRISILVCPNNFILSRKTALKVMPYDLKHDLSLGQGLAVCHAARHGRDARLQGSRRSFSMEGNLKDMDWGYPPPTTLHKTNIFAPTNGWLEYYFPIGEAYFQGLR